MSDRGVPFLDMQARLAPIRDELLAACSRVIDRGIFVMGPEAEALENEFAQYCGARYGVGVANGTVALQLALLALDIGPGDEVITVSNTFIATVEAISAVGATPVLVDIEPDTLLMDASLVEAAVTPRTKAIIPVHLYGLPCDMTAIRAIAARHGLRIIEDACQAHGASLDGQRTGSLGNLACFSFYPSKNLGTIGEGGMITTNDESLAARLRSLRSHGETTRYHHDEPGWNFRISEIQAAAARIELRRLEKWNAGRRQVAAWYGEDLPELPITLPIAPEGRLHVYHLYVVQVEDRDAVRQELGERGIGTGIHYPLPIHLQLAYRSLGYAGKLPITERAGERLVSLPMYAEMTREHVASVAAGLREVLRMPEAVR